jgi:hypothetical protein
MVALLISLTPDVPFNQRVESRLPGIVYVVLNRFNIEGLADFLDRTPRRRHGSSRCRFIIQA